MFTLTSALFVTLFATSWIFVLCQGTQELNVKPGEDVTLQCQSPRGADITFIEWNRTDLKSDLYVFLFRDNNSNAKNQHESFRGRANVSDPEMKNGDASVILKNVNTNDNGTYECRIKEGNNTGKPELINTIKLTVTGTQELKETAGEDATLQCQSHRGADITVLRWTRADLKPDDYILFFRDDGSKLLKESYRDRVELRDPERKDGDASLILKNININDTGTYECWIREKNKARRRKRDAEPKLISTIELKVTDGHKDEEVLD